jgi:hypothetical protein
LKCGVMTNKDSHKQRFYLSAYAAQFLTACHMPQEIPRENDGV